MGETKNPYFQAVQARTEEEANKRFDQLLLEARRGDAYLSVDEACERVVANLCYVAGYYDDATRERVVRLYSHRSPYRS